MESFASGEVDDILFPLIGTNPAIIMRPDTGAKAVGNQEFTGTGFLPSYGFGGNVGELVTADTPILAAGTLARTVA